SCKSLLLVIFLRNRFSVSAGAGQVKEIFPPLVGWYALNGNWASLFKGKESVMSNMFKTPILLAVIPAMLIPCWGAIAGRQGMMMAFIFAIAMNFFSYWFSDKIVLSMYGAQPIDEAQAPRLYAILHRLTTRAQIPMPRVYLIPTDTPNAFSTGRNPNH